VAGDGPLEGSFAGDAGEDKDTESGGPDVPSGDTGGGPGRTEAISRDAREVARGSAHAAYEGACLGRGIARNRGRGATGRPGRVGTRHDVAEVRGVPGECEVHVRILLQEAAVRLLCVAR